MTNMHGSSDVADAGVVGTFFHAPTANEFFPLIDVLIEIDGSGVIERILGPDDPDRAAAEARLGDRLYRLADGHYGLPGLVDLHVHAPQYPQLGLALDAPLEVWLQRYTFPLEAKYADPEFARERFTSLVEDLLGEGTTTALYFATQDRRATEILADICIERGQRALVGKVVMDDPESCPDYYRDADAGEAIADTRAVIDHIRTHPDNSRGRVLPVITPRFIPSCTDEALVGLGALAAESGCHVQTHCSESDWAHGHVLERKGVTDAMALDAYGLLTRKTVLAHSNFLAEADMDRLVARGSGVAHCALSNIYFANSVFPFRRAMEKGVHVGLGTDISGGPTSSMFEACRSTVRSSRMLNDGVNPDLPPDRRGSPGAAIDLTNAFHAATAGGGIALDLPIGIFAPGYVFDAVEVDTSARDGGIRLFDTVSPFDVFEKIVNGATRANVSRVWVDGREVFCH